MDLALVAEAECPMSCFQLEQESGILQTAISAVDHAHRAIGLFSHQGLPLPL
jgi:hypothetical protein